MHACVSILLLAETWEGQDATSLSAYLLGSKRETINSLPVHYLSLWWEEKERSCLYGRKDRFPAIHSSLSLTAEAGETNVPSRLLPSTSFYGNAWAKKALVFIRMCVSRSGQAGVLPSCLPQVSVVASASVYVKHFGCSISLLPGGEQGSVAWRCFLAICRPCQGCILAYINGRHSGECLACLPWRLRQPRRTSSIPPLCWASVRLLFYHRLQAGRTSCLLFPNIAVEATCSGPSAFCLRRNSWRWAEVS